MHGGAVATDSGEVAVGVVAIGGLHLSPNEMSRWQYDFQIRQGKGTVYWVCKNVRFQIRPY